jgi:DNA-binding SARP family transcriptional activator/tetratricopeptide (TPR) repeat protein
MVKLGAAGGAAVITRRVVFGVLGPVVVRSPAEAITIGEPRRRAVMSALLLEPGRTVSVDRVAALVWNTPPLSARKAVQVYVSQLRRLLSVLPDVEVVTERDGYRLICEPDGVDLHLFRRLVAAARRRTDPRERRELLGDALALWRGTAFADSAMDGLLGHVATGLEEERVAALEDRYEAELACGAHGHVLGQLMVSVAEHPLRERMVALLMTALHRCGRDSEAGDAYRSLRRRLVDNYGMEPSASLSDLHREILTGGGTADAAGRSPTSGPPPAEVLRPPAQLPADAAGFVGRQDVLARLDRLLSSAGAGGPSVAVVTGTAGVGKTATAVRWAHQVRGRFRDGQLFADLRGYAADPPMRPIDVLGQFLRALGVPPERVPLAVDEAAAMYRTLQAGKRMLVVLDNARDAEQVRPLLPGAPGCVALVTSRDRLTGLVALDGADLVLLSMLDTTDAHTLVADMLAPHGVHPTGEEIDQLASLCARLPLALRIAGARLAAGRHLPVTTFLAELREGGRLTSLQLDDPHAAVRSAFDRSYSALPIPARRLFRLLGLAPGLTISVEAAAALLGEAVDSAGQLLDILAAHHLVDQPAADQFGMHDLLRLYAAERAESEENQGDRSAATRRLFVHYVQWVDAAGRALYPHLLRLPLALGEPVVPPVPFADPAAALAWLEAERPNLAAAVTRAVDSGLPEFSWRLADALRGYFYLRMYAAEWQAIAAVAYSAAHSSGDLAARASAEFNLALVPWRQSRHEEAITHYQRARDLAQRAGWVAAEAAATGSLGNVYRQAGRLREARVAYQRVGRISGRAGQIGAQASSVGNLGLVYWEQGRVESAIRQYRRAVTLYRRLGSSSAEAIVLANLSDASRVLGRLGQAARYARDALRLARAVGHRASEADTLRCLAAVQLDAGHPDDAIDLAVTAFELAGATGHRRYQANALNVVAMAHHEQGRHGHAVDHFGRALDLVDATTERMPYLSALVGIAGANTALGRTDDAAAGLDTALDLARATGYRLVEGRAHLEQARLRLALGETRSALRAADEALTIHGESGYRLGQAYAGMVRQRALDALRRPAEAADAGEQARAIIDEVRGSLADAVAS